MVRILLGSIYLLLIFSSCSNEQEVETVPAISPPLTQAPAIKTPEVNETPLKYSYKIFLCDSNHKNGGYGYNIIVDEHTFIHQPTIPSISGNKGFSSEEQATIAAQFVIHKLTHNIMPPSVTPKELDSLGILK